MSIKSETGPITFGGQEHSVTSFKLSQLEVMNPLFEEFYRAGTVYTADGLRIGGKIIAEALGKTVDEIADTATTSEEIWDAVERIAEVSGLKKLGERLAPKAAKSSTSTTSTPSLLPSAPERGQGHGPAAPETSAN